LSEATTQSKLPSTRRGAPAWSVVDSPVSRIGAPLPIAGDVGRSRQSEPDGIEEKGRGWIGGDVRPYAV
jgi:hypothetical protein